MNGEHFFRIAVLTTLLGVAALPAMAESALSPPLLVVTEDRAPFTTLANDKPAGSHTAIVKALLETAGYQADIQILPWARSYATAQHRPNTLIYSMARSSPRENQFIWIGELENVGRWFFRLAGNRQAMPRSVEDIRANNVTCVVQGDIGEENLHQLGFKNGRNIVLAYLRKDCIKLVLSGSVSMLLESVNGVEWELARSRLPQGMLERVMPLLLAHPQPLYLAASQGSDPAMVKRLRNVWQQLEQSGELDRLRHMRPPIPPVQGLTPDSGPGRTGPDR